MSKRSFPPREFLQLGECPEYLGFKNKDTRPIKKMVEQGLPIIEINPKVKLIAIDDLRAFLNARKIRVGDKSNALAREILEGLK